MTVDSVPVTVNILDRDYQIACTADQVDGLKAAAKYVDQKMREVRDRGNVIGLDRIAVMVALNAAHEYLELLPLQTEQRAVTQQLGQLNQTLAEAIADYNFQT